MEKSTVAFSVSSQFTKECCVMSMQDKSKQIKEALRQGLLDGTSKLADRKRYRYDRAADGSHVINQEESEIVRRIFERYCDRCIKKVLIYISL